MKSYLTVVALLATLLVGACSKKTEDPNPNPNPTTADSFIKATVAGSAAFAAVGDISLVNGVRIASTDPTDTPARLVLRGTMKSNNNNITLTILKFTGAATYTLKADPDATLNTSLAGYSENGLNGPFYHSQYMTPQGATVGQIVVTSWDPAAKRIQGTFSFTAAGDASNGAAASATKQLTDGTFDVRDVALY